MEALRAIKIQRGVRERRFAIRRPRQAGFIALPLLVILVLVIVTIASSETFGGIPIGRGIKSNTEISSASLTKYICVRHVTVNKNDAAFPLFGTHAGKGGGKLARTQHLKGANRFFNHHWLSLGDDRMRRNSRVDVFFKIEIRRKLGGSVAVIGESRLIHQLFNRDIFVDVVGGRLAAIFKHDIYPSATRERDSFIWQRLGKEFIRCERVRFLAARAFKFNALDIQIRAQAVRHGLVSDVALPSSDAKSKNRHEYRCAGGIDPTLPSTQLLSCGFLFLATMAGIFGAAIYWITMPLSRRNLFGLGLMIASFFLFQSGITRLVNYIESVFSLLKRGVYGTFHSVSKKHLRRYLAEFDFRYNYRKVDDGERTQAAIRKSYGKRLRFREPVINVAGRKRKSRRRGRKRSD
jgi:hypothetical protein